MTSSNESTPSLERINQLRQKRLDIREADVEQRELAVSKRESEAEAWEGRLLQEKSRLEQITQEQAGRVVHANDDQELLAKFMKVQVELDEARSTLASLNIELQALKDDQNTLNQEKLELIEERKRFDLQLMELHSREGACREIESQNAEFQRIDQILRDQLDEYDQIYDKLNRELDEKENVIKTLSAENESLRAAVKVFENKISENDEKLKALKSDFKKIVEIRAEEQQKLNAQILLVRQKSQKILDLEQTESNLRRLLKNKSQDWEQERARLESKLKTNAPHRIVTASYTDQPRPDPIGVVSNLHLIGTIPGVGFPDEVKFPDTISLSGWGPWKVLEFNKLLLGQDIKTKPMPDEDVAVIVLGREGWDKKALLEHIKLRESLPKIYSQELFLAGLMRGEDPLESWDEEVLNVWGEDHPALRYLMGQDLPWPRVREGGADFDPELIYELHQADCSPLSEMGYHVGRTSKLSPRERRQILRKGTEGALPWVESDEYMSTWGKPRTPQRLYRIAWHLAWLANTQGKADNKGAARKDWISDLEWLKKEFYPAYGRGKKWPST